MNHTPIAACLLLVVAATGSFTPQEDPNAPLAVRIVPSGFTDTGTRSILLADRSQHFSVVITNTGKNTIRLWKESCSWGYRNLSFEAEVEGKGSVHVTKKERGWEKNFPDWIAVPPGDHLVLEVSFDPVVWQNSPLRQPGDHRLVSLRAVYESAADKESQAHQVWSGKVVSPRNTYTIFQ